MSTSTVPSTHTADSSEPTRSKRRWPVFRLTLLLVLLWAASLFVPACFRFEARQFLLFEAWRSGVSASVGAVEGSLLGPVTVRESIWIYESVNGPVTRLEIQEMRAKFAWRNLFSRGSKPWFEQLSFDGVVGKVHLPIETRLPELPRVWKVPRPRGRWVPSPQRIEAQNVDFIFQSDGDYVRLQEARCTVSELAPGEIFCGQVIIKQPWLQRTFRNASGTTKLDDTRAELANVTLEPGVQIRSLAAKLDEMAKGRLNLEMQLAAFGGAIRIETQTFPRDHQLAFEATGTFSEIGVARLASFLGTSEAAGGTIKSGNFTFRGPPQNPAKAFARLRLEATDFQWDSRQWDSLVFGGTLMDGRVQVPQLTLHQGHNHVTLNGDFLLPAVAQQWWQSEFSFNLAAKIENLTELSALMLPEFKFAAGQGTIDGSVRGQNQEFQGQIIVNGSDLKWRNAPIDDLHATLKLNGNELQLTNFSIFNDGDFLRGRGVVNILGDKQYWGEVRGSIDDLGKYAAILQKPIVPEPLAGGAVIDWSGEGSARGHTGKFLARLRKVRSLGASAALLHPINADLEGTYAPGSMLFSRFGLSDDESSFVANVAVGNKALSLQGIRFIHRKALQLEGDALLPLDVWRAWPNTSPASLLDDTTPSKVNLTAYSLDLQAISQLTGWNFPIEGLVTGNVAAEGTFGALRSNGRLALTKGRLPLGWTGILLGNAEAAATLEGQKLTFAKFSTSSPVGEFTGTGSVDFANPRDPVLALDVQSSRLAVALFAREGRPPVQVKGSLLTRITGPASVGVVEGTLLLASSELGLPSPDEAMGASTGSPIPRDLTWLFTEPSFGEIPPVFTWTMDPWANWIFNVTCTAPHPTELIDSVNLVLTGRGAQPVLNGSVAFQEFEAVAGTVPLTVQEAALTWREGRALLDGRATGRLFGQPFSAQVVGPLTSPARFLDLPAELDAVGRHALTEAVRWSSLNREAPFSLGLHEPSLDALPAYAWPLIETSSPPEVVPQPAPEAPAPSASAPGP